MSVTCVTPQAHVSQASRRCLSDERSAICMFLLCVESQSIQVVYVPAAENNILSFSIGCMTSASVGILDNRKAYESHAHALRYTDQSMHMHQ